MADNKVPYELWKAKEVNLFNVYLVKKLIKKREKNANKTVTLMVKTSIGMV